MKLLCTVAAFCIVSFVYAQKFQGMAKTPPMGWNTWNKYACNINEELIRQTADTMVLSGMREAGYVYLIMDDCWQGRRDNLGFIHPDPVNFPSGIRALSDYVHTKGLKLGIYSDAGNTTCGHRPGSRGHEYQDAVTYASWGIDYLKYDWCDTKGLNVEAAYTTMRDALYAAGRPVVFGLCEWGDNKPWEWAPPVGHLWRTTGDIYPCFDCKHDHGGWFSWGFVHILDKQESLRKYAGPDRWNDPDMMEVGNGMTQQEDRAHFSLWAMLAAPLIAGNDIVNMKEETKKILLNKEVIAIDQDLSGIQGFKYTSKDSVETWVKPLQNNDWAICFFNRGKNNRYIEQDSKSLFIKDSLSGQELNTNVNRYSIRNIWEKKSNGNTGKPFRTTIPGHDVILLRLSD